MPLNPKPQNDQPDDARLSQLRRFLQSLDEFDSPNRALDLKILNYYKGLVNENSDSFEHSHLATLWPDHNSEASTESPKLHTPKIGSRADFSDLSPLVFVDSPVRHAVPPPEPPLPVDEVDLRLVKDGTSSTFAWLGDRPELKSAPKEVEIPTKTRVRSPLAPKLKSVRSLPQMRRLNSLRRRAETTTHTPTNSTTFMEMPPVLHTRGNSSSSSIGRSSVREFHVPDDGSFTNFRKNFHPMARHAKSGLGLTTESGPTDDVAGSPLGPPALPRLNTVSLSSNVIGKLRSGIKKLSSPVSPKSAGFFPPSIDSVTDHEEDLENGSFRGRARLLARKASSTSLYRSRSAKVPVMAQSSKTPAKTPVKTPSKAPVSRSKSATVTSNTTEESCHSNLKVCVDDSDGSDVSSSPPLMLPVIKVNALSAQFNEPAFISGQDPLQEALEATNEARAPASREELAQKLTKCILQMKAEDEAFAMTQRRLEQSGWYSRSNINDIQRRREHVRQTWTEKIAALRLQLDLFVFE